MPGNLTGKVELGIYLDAQNDGALTALKQVEQAVAKVNAEAAQGGKTQQKKGGIGGLVSSIAGLAGPVGAAVVVANQAWEMGERLVGFGRNLVEMYDQASRNEAAISALERFGQKGSIALERLRHSTGGLIDDAELATAANKARLLGANLDQTTQALSLALAVSRQTGVDFRATFDQIVEAAATGSDAFGEVTGRTVDFSAAQESAASSLNKTVEQLTQSELHSINLTAAMRGVGGASQYTADQITQLSNQINLSQMALSGWTKQHGDASDRIEALRQQTSLLRRTLKDLTASFLADMDVTSKLADKQIAVQAAMQTGNLFKIQNAVLEFSAAIGEAKTATDALAKAPLGSTGDMLARIASEYEKVKAPPVERQRDPSLPGNKPAGGGSGGRRTVQAAVADLKTADGLRDRILDSAAAAESALMRASIVGSDLGDVERNRLLATFAEQEAITKAEAKLSETRKQIRESDLDSATKAQLMAVAQSEYRAIVEQARIATEKVNADAEVQIAQQKEDQLRAISDARQERIRREAETWQYSAGVIAQAANSISAQSPKTAQAFGGLATAASIMGDSWGDSAKLAPSIISATSAITAGLISDSRAQAAVLGVMELAAGFAQLFVNPAASASHFLASGLYFSVAGSGKGGSKNKSKPASAFTGSPSSGGLSGESGSGGSGSGPVSTTIYVSGWVGDPGGLTGELDRAMNRSRRDGTGVAY